MISVTRVFHHYGLRPTLDNISFAVEAGRTLAIVGPNGSGKTTLMELLAGLASPAEGQVTVNGIERRSTVDNELAIRRQTFFLPASSWFPRNITGRQMLMATGECWQISVRRCFEHIERLLTVFQLGDIADSDVTGYSTGQRKKLSLCSALISQCPILLLDEPFSGGLDPAGITAMKQILQHLTSQEDRTVVLTSPVPELVEEVADEVLILQSGEIVEHAPVSELKKKVGAASLDEALRQLIFPETQDELRHYFEQEMRS